MHKWPYGEWVRASMDAWALGLESSSVIGLRLTQMATGGVDCGDEARLMVSEKMGAAFELQAALLTGALGGTPLAGTQRVLRHYRRKVKANRRRLG